MKLLTKESSSTIPCKFKQCFLFIFILTQTVFVGFSQDLKESNINSLGGQQISADEREQLQSNLKNLTQETLFEILYRNRTRKEVMDSYDSETENFSDPEDLQIEPLEFKNLGRDMSILFFTVEPWAVEAIGGGVKVARLLVGNQWVNEVYSMYGHDGTLMPGKYESFLKVKSDTLIVAQDHTQMAPGLMYYIDRYMDFDHFEHHRITTRTVKCLIEPAGFQFLNYTEELNHKFPAREEMTEYLQNNDNVDPLISKVDSLLDSERDKDEKKYQLIKAYYENQQNLKSDAKSRYVAKISGNQIWVRDAPSNGEVIMKLNNGTIVFVMDQGPYEEIRDMQDYWYQINYKGKIGWVYGSQLDKDQLMLDRFDEEQADESSVAKDNEADTVQVATADNTSPSSEESKSSEQKVLDYLMFLVPIFMIGFIFWLGYVASRKVRKLKRGYDQKGDVGSFLDGEVTLDEGLMKEIGSILDNIELLRFETRQKAKFHYPRLFLKTYLIIFLIMSLFVYFTAPDDGQGAMDNYLESALPLSIGSFGFTLIISGFIYLFTSSKYYLRFNEYFKNEAVEKLIHRTLPGSQYVKEGLTGWLSKSRLFYKAEKEQSGHLLTYNDGISGKTRSNHTYRITEVEHRAELQESEYDRRRKKEFKEKHNKSSTGGSAHVGKVYYDVFKGLLAVYEIPALKKIDSLKIIPEKLAEEHYDQHLENLKKDRQKSRKQVLLALNQEDRVNDSTLENIGYQLFSNDKENTTKLMKSYFKAWVEEILNKYNSTQSLSDILGLEDENKSEDKASVFLSLQKGELFIAIHTDKHLFESPTSLKESLKESGLEARLFSNLALIHQIVSDFEKLEEKLTNRKKGE